MSATFAASLVTSPAIGAYLSVTYGDTLVVILATAIALLDICFILVAVPESLPEKMRPASWGAPISWEQADPFAVRNSPLCFVFRFKHRKRVLEEDISFSKRKKKDFLLSHLCRVGNKLHLPNGASSEWLAQCICRGTSIAGHFALWFSTLDTHALGFQTAVPGMTAIVMSWRSSSLPNGWWAFLYSLSQRFIVQHSKNGELHSSFQSCVFSSMCCITNIMMRNNTATFGSV